MSKEEIDGTTVYSGLHTDEAGNTWNVLFRTDGSVSLYITKPESYAHGVIFDTLAIIERERAKRRANERTS